MAAVTAATVPSRVPLLPDSLGRRLPSPTLQANLPEFASTPIWIFFTDKRLRDASHLASEWRRLKWPQSGSGRWRSPDALDLPVPDEYVAAVAATGVEIRHASRWFNAVSVRTSPKQLARLLELPCVAEVRPVRRGRPLRDFSPSRGAGPTVDAAYARDYGLSLVPLLPLQVPELHALGLSGSGVILAVLDSGFRLTHRTFDQLVATGSVLDRWDFVHGDSSVANDSLDLPGQDFHGTEVLSTMAGYSQGELTGPAWDAQYLLAKTEDIASETPVEEDHYVAALEWADSLGARVISSSLSYDFGYTLDGTEGICTVAANTASARGMLVVTAMGNAGPGPTSLGAPADAFDIVSVGAVDAAGVIANFSSRGPTADGRIKPEVVAQGVSVYVADPSQEDAYLLASGTSFSTPLTSASAALLAQAHADWSPSMLREALLASGDRTDTPNADYGWGRFRLLLALDYEPAGALRMVPHWYDAYDSSSWRVAVSTSSEFDRKPAEVTVMYELVPGTQDSLALTSQGDTLWEATLPFAGEDELWWRVRVRDSLGRLSFYPADPWRKLEMRRLPDALSEDFERGGLRWERGGTHPLWWPSAADVYEGQFSLSDSPGGPYPESCDAWTVTRLPVRVGFDLPWSLQFVTRYQFGSGDSGKIEWCRARDTSWQVLATLTGTQSSWLPQTYSLSAVASDSVWLRFRLVSDAAITGDGWYIDKIYLGGAPMDIAASPDVVPTASLLLQPTPNPFNQSTRLGFELDRPAEVRLLVYDVLGRRVRSLWSGKLEAGPRHALWDGHDDRGRPLPSGLYVARLEVNDHGFTRKLLLLK